METITSVRDGSKQISPAHLAARSYLDAGFAVVPVGKNKVAALPSGHQNFVKRQTREEVDRYYTRPGLGVGIVCGEISGGLQVLDIEFEDYFDQFAERLEANQPGLLARLPRIETPGKEEGNPGVHLFYRTTAKPPGQKLARLSPEEAELRTRDKGKTTGIECKSSGYVVAPGSPGHCHPSGRQYKHVAGPRIEQTPMLTAEEAEAIYRCAKALDHTTAIAAKPSANSCSTAFRVQLIGDRPGDRFNQNATWDDVFHGTGWAAKHSQGKTYWTRPGKDDGTSATSGHCTNQNGEELFYCFSSNAEPFEAGKTYSKFAVWSLLHHNGDFTAATKAAAALYPDQQVIADKERFATLQKEVTANPRAYELALEHLELLARIKAKDPAAYTLFLLKSGMSKRDQDALSRTANQLVKEANQAEKQAKKLQHIEKREQQLVFRNFRDIPIEGANGVIGTKREGLTLDQIQAQLEAIAPGWPKRLGKRLFTETIKGDRPDCDFLDKPSELFSWIGQKFQLTDANPIDWARGSNLNSEERFFSHLQQQAEQYSAIEQFPHSPPMPDTYYCIPPVKHSNGKRLQELLAFFKLGLIDQDLFLAYLLTFVWGGPPGARPAFCFTSADDDPENGRGVGKTTLAMVASQLFGGHVSIEPRDDYSRLITRLLSGDGLKKRLILLDNLKSNRFSCDSLEGMITIKEFSGHLMYAGEGTRPNTMIVAITVNGARLSKDMAQRCVIVVVQRPDRDPTWQTRLDDHIELYRWEIIGDLIEILKGQPKEIKGLSRWALWEREVLSRASEEPNDALKTLAERRDTVDDDNESMELVREDFRRQLHDRRHDPDTEVIFIPSRTAAEWTNDSTGEKRSTPKACSHLKGLGIPELRESKKDGKTRGYRWTGPKNSGGVMQELKPDPFGGR